MAENKLIGVSQRDKEQIVRDTTSMLNAFEIAYGFDPKYSDMTFFISGNEVSAEEMVDYISNQVDVSGVKAAMDAKRKQAEEDAAYAAAKGADTVKPVKAKKKTVKAADATGVIADTTEATFQFAVHPFEIGSRNIYRMRIEFRNQICHHFFRQLIHIYSIDILIVDKRQHFAQFIVG